MDPLSPIAKQTAAGQRVVLAGNVGGLAGPKFLGVDCPVIEATIKVATRLRSTIFTILEKSVCVVQMVLMENRNRVDIKRRLARLVKETAV